MRNRSFGEMELEWIDPEEYIDVDSKWMYLCTLHEWVNGVEKTGGEEYDIVVNNGELRYTQIDLI